MSASSHEMPTDELLADARSAHVCLYGATNTSFGYMLSGFASAAVLLSWLLPSLPAPAHLGGFY